MIRSEVRSSFRARIAATLGVEHLLPPEGGNTDCFLRTLFETVQQVATSNQRWQPEEISSAG